MNECMHTYSAMLARFGVGGSIDYVCMYVCMYV